MNVIDSYGLYHDKPVIDGKPSSNNGFIYSAYAKKLGLPVGDLSEVFNNCLVNGKFIKRLPNKPLPVVSKDELLGSAALGLLKQHHLNGFNFSPYPSPAFKLRRFLEQLLTFLPTKEPTYHKDQPLMGYYIRHRDHIWREKLDQLYGFMFSVPLTDRYFLLDKWGNYNKFNPIHQIYRLVAKFDSLLPKENGIRWLKYGGDKNMRAMIKEFPEGHPFKEKKVTNGSK